MTRLVLLIGLLAAIPAAAGSSKLQLHLIYPTVFDDRCEDFTKTKAAPAWIDLANKRWREFQARWDREGPVYLNAAIDEIGMPFPFREMQAYVTVCVQSMSGPLMVNLRDYLTDPVTGKPPRWPMWIFAETVFHELMHHYVEPVMATSKLRQKYSAESATVQGHLHVMAIEKLVLTKLRSADDLRFMDEEYRNRSGPAYKRAWEIVNDAEGPDAFIKELRALKHARAPH